MVTETQAFLSIRGVIGSVVNKWCRKFPQLDKEELLGQSNLFTVGLLRKYDPSRGAKLSTWIHVCLNRYLHDRICGRSNNWYRRHCKHSGFDNKGEYLLDHKHWSLREFLTELSESAQKAIRIVLACERQGGVMRRTVHKEIRELLGTEEMDRVFSEIREAL